MFASARSRILAVSAIVAAAAGLSVLSLIIGPLDPPWARAGSVDEIDDAGVTYLEELNVFLVAEDPSPIALVGLSTHMPDEPVLFCASAGWFFSPFHGEKFDRSGVYADGPAPRGLDRVAVRVIADTVYVDPTSVEVGPPRGHKPEDPAGSFCDEGSRVIAPGIVKSVGR